MFMENQKTGIKAGSKGLVRCVTCRHFSYYENDKGHNSPQALGRCGGEPWDGNSGQWAMLQHPCKRFTETEAPAHPDQD